MASPSLRRVVVSTVLTLLLPACSSFRVKEQSTSGDGIVHSELRHSFLWGLVTQPIELHQSHADERYRCAGRGLHEVTVDSGFFGALATVLTLGIWTPAEVTWRCQPASDFGPRDEPR